MESFTIDLFEMDWQAIQLYGELEFVEVPLAAGGAKNGSDSGISLHAAGFEIQVTCDFDQATLLNVLTVLRTLACSVSAEQ